MIFVEIILRLNSDVMSILVMRQDTNDDFRDAGNAHSVVFLPQSSFDLRYVLYVYILACNEFQSRNCY